MTNPTDSTEQAARTVETVTAELHAGQLARESLTGREKGLMTTKVRALEAELAKLRQPEPKVPLKDLEARIADHLAKSGTEPTRDEMLAVGNPVVQAGLLKGYTAKWADNGRWLGKQTEARIKKAVAARKS